MGLEFLLYPFYPVAWLITKSLENGIVIRENVVYTTQEFLEKELKDREENITRLKEQLSKCKTCCPAARLRMN